MEQIGVTRVGEVTYLDRNGVPGFIAVRPLDIGPSISYYNGKGSTKAQARASAMMEAIERYCGEHCDYPVIVDSWGEMRERGQTVDPRALLVPRVGYYGPNVRMEWILGFDLLNRQPTYTPLNSVVCPYEPAREKAVFFTSTNGLASGNTMADALSHALCEINERDAMAIAAAVCDLSPAIGNIVKSNGRSATPRLDRFPLIEQKGLPLRAARVLGRLRRAGLRVYLRNITSDTQIPTIECTVVGQDDGFFDAHGGFGSHPDVRVALLRALTEAAQSRLACIQGGREDLPDLVRSSARVHDPDRLFGSARVVSLDSIPTRDHQSVEQDVAYIIECFKTAGFEQTVAFDLTRRELGVPVVRVVVPNAEAWSVFHLHTGRGVFGRRVRKVLSGVDS